MGSFADRQTDKQTNAGTGTVKDVKSAMGKELYVNNYCLLYEGLIVIVIVNSRFLQRPRKQNNGNQLIERRNSS